VTFLLEFLLAAALQSELPKPGAPGAGEGDPRTANMVRRATSAPTRRERVRALIEWLTDDEPDPRSAREVAEARRAARHGPDEADEWHELGDMLSGAGRHREAVEAYERATHLEPFIVGRAYLFRDLALARERAGDLRGALAAARISVTSTPLTEEGIWCMGPEAFLMTRLLLKLGDLDGAVDFYRPVAEVKPLDPDCRLISNVLQAARTVN
jgi:tetratricopeptide (TPR) repeat protein